MDSARDRNSAVPLVRDSLPPKKRKNRLCSQFTDFRASQKAVLPLDGNLVHFAGCAHHIGLSPTPTGVARCKRELSTYKNAKGSAQFPLDEPLSLDLIERIVKFRVEESARKGRKEASCRRSHGSIRRKTSSTRSPRSGWTPLTSQRQRSPLSLSRSRTRPGDSASPGREARRVVARAWRGVSPRRSSTGAGGGARERAFATRGVRRHR